MTRILFVDDTEDIRYLFEATVAAYDLPWQVDLAPNGKAALNLFGMARNAGTPYDLIVWDISMPDFSGLRAAGAIRDAGDAKTKFMVYSGRDGEQDRRAAAEVGALAYLVKSTVTPQQLIEEIRRAIEASEPGPEAQPQS